MSQKSWATGGPIIVCLLIIGACNSFENEKISTLRAPGGTKPQALTAMNQGNKAFGAGQWAVAGEQYEHAIKVQPTLAEAHYNLALTLDQLGNQTKADEHYTQAANLAPGHTIIWNSRKYRRYGDVSVQQKGSSAPVLPGLGGLGGSLPSGGF